MRRGTKTFARPPALTENATQPRHQTGGFANELPISGTAVAFSSPVARHAGGFAMPHRDCATEAVDDTPPPDPRTVAGMILERAYRYGQRARPHYAAYRFEEVERKLRAGWLIDGEMAPWPDVRDAVRRGFEQQPMTGG